MSHIKTITSVFSALLGVLPVLANAAPADLPSVTTTEEMLEYTIFSAPETHLPLRLKPRKPQIVHLDSEVGDVTVDDMPAHVSAVVYDRTSIALVPQSPGAAHITVFGKNGVPLMARYVVVSDPARKYVRIRQTCKKETGAVCEKMHVYYCPNLCYRTRIVGAAERPPVTSK